MSPSEMADPNPFAFSGPAGGEFEAAMKLIKEPPYTDAVDRFTKGLGYLGISEVDLTALESGTDTPSLPVTLQASEGFRNLGFTHFRGALLATPGTGDYQQRAERAARLLGVADNIAQLALKTVAELPSQYSEDQQAQALAYAGVARALILRTASGERHSSLPQKRAFGSESFGWMGIPDLGEADMNTLFGRVDTDLARGNNGYWRISNAMVALRDLRAGGASLFSREARGWYRRLHQAWQWTREHDRDNFSQATRTIIRHGLSLGSRRSARQAATSPQRI